MRKQSDTMSLRDFMLKKALSKEIPVGKEHLILICRANGYKEDDVRKEVKELRKVGLIYCVRREEFFKLT